MAHYSLEKGLEQDNRVAKAEKRYRYTDFNRWIFMGNIPPHRITIIAPTCFYYQAPLFRALSSDERIDLTVVFCTDEGVSGTDIKAAYGADESWGRREQLLGGYKSKSLKNHVPKGSYLKSLVGLFNLGIWSELRRERPDAVAIMSWMNPTWWLTVLACLKFRIPILLMTDANVDAENLSSSWKTWAKRVLLAGFLFRSASGFLCAGTSNRQLYTYYGVPDDKLYPFAYSWGYGSLIEQSKQLHGMKSELRTEYGLPEDSIIALYCGRFSAEKGSIELVDAFKYVSNPRAAVVLGGDGGLRSRMQASAVANGIESIYFMGFQGREEIAKFYALADFLVLPSHKETWGMVVNEGLCFSLPLVVSDQVGAGPDLVKHGVNGHVFPAGDVSALAEGMSTLTDLSEEDRLKMGETSWNLINDWAGRDIASILVEYFQSRGSETNLGLIGFPLKVFRGLPEPISHFLGVLVVGSLWMVGLTFLLFRPFVRRLRGVLRRVRR